MRTESVPVDELHHDPANARIHSSRNLEAIKASLARFGQQKPIVVDKGNVVRAGNGTLEAARSLGWEEISVVRSELLGAEMTAFAIADNRTAELAEWDQDVLAASLQALDEEDLPASDIGFSAYEMREILDSTQPPVEIQQDDPSEAPADPITKPGDLWLLGEHRVLCGDATDREDVERLLEGTRPRLMVTDPPYGVDYTGGVGNDSDLWVQPERERLEGDDSADLYIPAMVVAAEVLDPSAAVYLWHADIHADTAISSARIAGFEPRAVIVWNKGNAHYGAFMAHYLQKHEPCLYAVRGSAHFVGASNEKTVWDIDQPSRNEHHPTQKPVEVMARAIRNHDAPEVMDPFLGSGTTLIAAHQLGRRCYGIEISPAYCDVIVRRWETLTGLTAVRVGQGETPSDRTTDSPEGGS